MTVITYNKHICTPSCVVDIATRNPYFSERKTYKGEQLRVKLIYLRSSTIKLYWTSENKSTMRIF